MSKKESLENIESTFIEFKEALRYFFDTFEGGFSNSINNRIFNAVLDLNSILLIALAFEKCGKKDVETP
jgi:hypothetical protein